MSSLSPAAETKPPRRLFWFIVGLGLVLFTLWVVDFVRFANQYRRYSLAARTGAAQLTSPVSSTEAIVVLTGDRKRIARALELLRNRRSPLLIISGTGRGTTLTELINQQGKEATTALHEIWKKIVLESRSSSTIENAEESLKIFKAKQITQVILVTSDYHMHRSLEIFRRLAPDQEYIPFAIDSEGGWWKPWLEYWKYSLYHHYLAQHLDPAQK